MRRAWVALFLLSVAAVASAAAPFRFEQINDKSIKLWEGDRPVLVYNFGEIASRATTRPTAGHSNYIHPLYGMDGEVLTDDFSADHVHHRGLYWAWPHVKVGDKPYDLWSLKGIRYGFVEWLEKKVGADEAVLRLSNGWLVGEKCVMREEVRLGVHRAGADSRAIDLELTWTPTEEPITLWGAEGKSYGGLALRFAPRKKTIITTPAGETKEDQVVTHQTWADLSGDLSDRGISGAAIFVHNSHFDYPPEWMTRHYGMLAVGWPGVKPKTINPNEPIRCSYRIWIHRGSPDVKSLQQAYDAYLAEPRKENE